MSAKVLLFSLFLLFCFKSASLNDQDIRKFARDDEITHNKCENVKVDLCQDVGYSQTIMPNLVGSRNQKDAESDLKQFSQLISSKCSSSIKLFLCSVYVPVCTSLEHALPPCKSLCLLAKDGCEQFMRRFGFSWPEILNCNKFKDIQPCIEKRQENSQKDEFQIIHQDLPHNLKTSKEIDYKIFLGPSLLVENCGIPCNDTFMFLGGTQSSARIFVGLFSCFCLVSSLVTVSTFLVDKKRFVYPQRPFVFVAVCHAFVCVVYAVGFASGGRIACTEAFPENEPPSRSLVAVQGSHKGFCSMLFAFLYYFQLTGHMWWIGFNLAWLMSACLKWSQEAITRNSKYLHAVIWILPGVQTLFVMFLARLEGDPIVGICTLVEPNQVKVLLFVPLVFLSVLGIFCWSASLVGLNKVRMAVRNEGVCPEKLNKLMVRIGSFGLLYSTSMIIYMVCIFYEQMMRYEWRTHWFFSICPWCQEEPPLGTSGVYSSEAPVPPNFVFHSIKNISLLSTGFWSGFWVWNRKMCVSWEPLFKLFKQ